MTEKFGYEDMSIATMHGGEDLKRIDYELAKAISHIMDPNTDAEAKRQVTIKIVIKPAADRKSASLVMEVSSKLPSDVPSVSTIAIGNHGEASVLTMEQVSMDFENVAELQRQRDGE